MLSINNVAAKLGLSVHQLRRWELMFGLEIKRGRGQQRQYREEDMSVLERIKELVEQGWPTSQIRPQLEAEGLLSPKLIGAPPAPGNPEVLQEAIIGLRNFSERRFIDLSKQIDELRQLLISVTLKQELSTDRTSPWQPMASEYVPAPKAMPAQEITIGPQISIDPPKSSSVSQSMMGMPPSRVNQIPPSSTPSYPTSSASTGSSTSSSSHPSVSPSISSASVTPSSSSPNTDFSQRSMLGSGAAAGAESKTSIPDIDQAPKPIIDALQRSMSTLDSLFKDQRNTPGLGTIPGESSTTSSSTSSSSLPPALPSGQPVRHSTIPPLPTAPTTSTTSASQTPAVSPSSAAFGSSSSAAITSPSSSTNAASPGTSPTTSSLANQNAVLPNYAVSTSVEAPAVPSSQPPTSAAEAAAQAPASAWDQAFSSTSVDIDALPASGLFEDSSAAQPMVDQSSSRPTGSAFPAPAQAPPAGYSSERNPFTTITSTNTSAVDPQASSSPSLMGQTNASSQGFTAASAAASNTSFGQNLSQTGPLPAHTSVESFAPELKEKLIASQSDSTSTDLPQSGSIPGSSSGPASGSSSASSAGPASTLEPEPSAPPAPIIQPALPLATGPQVNFGPNVSAPTPQVTPQRMDDNFGLGEVTDQNYLTVLGRALDLIGWSDEQADSFSLKTFGVPHWDELGRSQAEKLVAHLVGLLKDQLTQ
jgi:DNA-binding transcriptional MerR regulator